MSYITTQFISNGFEMYLPQKIKGKHKSLIHTGTVEISISGLKLRVQWERNIPLEPMKQGQNLKIRSRSSLV
jgi:hypothetical protein